MHCVTRVWRRIDSSNNSAHVRESGYSSFEVQAGEPLGVRLLHLGNVQLRHRGHRVLTVREFFEIALVLVRFDHIAAR